MRVRQLATSSITALGSLLLVMSFATGALAQITGSAHDFSVGFPWNTTGEICVTCHTPHDADTTVAASPLWNHETTTQTFTPYDSVTFDGSGTIGQPGGISLLCLSCHDGSVALDNFGGTTGGTNFMAAAFVVGEDPDGAGPLGPSLQDEHPIGFTYDNALFVADPELYDPGVQASGLGGTIAQDMLFADQLECASCHDPHNTANEAFLLVKSNTTPASGLCLTCHNK